LVFSPLLLTKFFCNEDHLK
jgi:hypothetical protein